MDLLIPQPYPKESNREYACRVLREIGDHDREYYFRDKKLDPAIFDAVREEN